MCWESPPNNWNDLRDWFEGLHGDFFNRRVNLYRTMRKAGSAFNSVPALEAELRHADWVFAQPIQQYISAVADHWQDPPDLDAYPPGALPLLRLRVDALMSWVGDHVHDDKRLKNPVRVPAVPFPDLFRWLFDTWWQERGRRVGAEELVIDHLYFERWDFAPVEKVPKRRRTRRATATIRACDEEQPEPDSWETLANWLEAHLTAFAAFPSSYDILREKGQTFTDVEEVFHRLREVEESHDDVLPNMLLTWIKRRHWPRAAIDPVLGSLIAIRLRTAADWARTHAVQEANLIPYPETPLQKVLRWLLISWWDRPGRYRAAYSLQLKYAQRGSVCEPEGRSDGI